METLIVLVQNRGRVMDQDELLAALWPDTVVEEANLTQNISTLRKALGDNPKDHFYIATVAGRGYQFAGPVTELTSETPRTEGTVREAPQESAPDSITLGSRIKRHNRIAISVVAVAISLV